MEQVIAYISEFGTATAIISLPFLRKLYLELLALRKENGELREKLAYLKGKYTDKVVLKSHGKKKRKDEGEEEF